MSTKEQPRRRRSVFAIDAENRVYVQLNAVMSTLTAMIDGVSVTRFPPERTAYLPVPDAVAWIEKELTHPGVSSKERADYETRLAVLRRVQAGDFKVNEDDPATA